MILNNRPGRIRDLFASIGAALIVLVPTPATAQPDMVANDQVTIGPVPDWVTPSEPLAVPAQTSGLAFMRSQDALIHLDPGGQSTYNGMRIKLLQPQALQFGNIGISWNPAAGVPIVHTVRIHREGQTTDVLQTSKFEVLRRESQLEEAILSGTLTAFLKVPDLRVGDELEVAYTVPTGDPTLRDQAADSVMLTGSTLPGRYHLGVSWADAARPEVRSTDDFSVPLVRSARAVDVQVDNPPTLTPPKDAPPRYSWQRVIEFSTFGTWGAVSRRFADLFAEASTLEAKSPLEQEADRIAASHSGQLDRAQAALALVQQQVRYVYVGLNGGNLRPTVADETWRRRYGDCKAKTALLLALLDRLGIAAQPVLVRNEGSDDGFDARLPNPGLFDHVLVRATIGGKHYWLDGTLPVVATARVVPEFPYHWVLPLVASGKQPIERLIPPVAETPAELTLYEIDARAGFDQPARKTTTAIKRGPEALGEYLGFSALTDQQLLESFRNNVGGNSDWDTIESVKYRFDVAARAGILEIVGTGKIDWDNDGGGRRSLSLPGGGFSPPGRRLRATNQDQAAPFYSAPRFDCFVTTVRLPSQTKPENWIFNSTFDSLLYGRLYYRAFERREATIRMIRGSRIERPEIDRKEADRDNERLSRFDNSMAWIHYLPDKQVPSLPHGSTVPATFEGDWVQDASACLPADVGQ